MRRISQRELRNQSGDVMRDVEAGESFVVTRNGVPIAELRPLARETFVRADVALASLGAAARIDGRRFRRDLDRSLDQRTSR